MVLIDPNQPISGSYRDGGKRNGDVDTWLSKNITSGTTEGALGSVLAGKSFLYTLIPAQRSLQESVLLSFEATRDR